MIKLISSCTAQEFSFFFFLFEEPAKTRESKSHKRSVAGINS